MNNLPFPEEEENESPGTELGLFSGEITKGAISERAKEFFELNIETGEQDPLDTYIKAKAASEYFSEVQKLVKPEAEKEAAKYSKGENFLHGVEFEMASQATRYSYDHDETWNEINDKIKDLEKKRKKREDQMKKAMEFGGVFDEEGVEVPAAKYKSGGGESIRITIPKK